METILIVFVTFACIVCLFSTVLITMETIHNMKERRENAAPQPQTAQVTPPVDNSTVVTTPSTVQDVTPEEQPTDDGEIAATNAPQSNGIWISAGKSQTLEEKYLELSAEQRSWYDEIVKHAMLQEAAKRFKNDRYEEYKVGKHRLVRLTIKRRIIQCEFVLINQDFRNYINDNKISVKTAATIIKIENAEAVATAKNSIDIAMKSVEEERLYKAEQRKARRREKKARSLENV